MNANSRPARLRILEVFAGTTSSTVQSEVPSYHLSHARFGKKTAGGAGTHTGHTRDTRAHKGTRITQTNLKTIQTHLEHTNPYCTWLVQGLVRVTTEGAAAARPTQQPQARSRPLPAAYR